MHIEDNELEDLRDTLEVEQATIQEELSQHGGRDERGDWSGNSSGLKGEEADPTDVADQIEELVTNTPLVEELEKRLREVKGALKKMDAGEYGVCEECGAEIPLDRLQANPAARTCVQHAQ
jgi:DnaK suppressor protein